MTGHKSGPPSVFDEVHAMTLGRLTTTQSADLVNALMRRIRTERSMGVSPQQVVAALLAVFEGLHHGLFTRIEELTIIEVVVRDAAAGR